MRHFIVLVMMFGFIMTNGQSAIDNHFQYLVEDDNSTNINVTGKMFQMLNSIEINSDEPVDEDLQDMKEFIGSINSFHMVVGKQLTNTKSKYDSGAKTLHRKYEELVSVVDKEGEFLLFVDEHNGTVTEVVGIGNHEDHLMVFSLLGDMQLEQVGKVMQHVQSGGFEHLEKIQDMNPDDVKIYPNPVSRSSGLTLETDEGFKGVDGTLYDASGQLVKRFVLKGDKQKLDISGLSAGSYVLKIENDGVSIKKKVLIVQ